MFYMTMHPSYIFIVYTPKHTFYEVIAPVRLDNTYLDIRLEQWQGIDFEWGLVKNNQLLLIVLTTVVMVIKYVGYQLLLIS